MESDQFKKSEIKGMFDGPLIPVIVKLSLPILAGILFQLLYTIIDTAFINFIDPTNPAILGGTGLIFPLLFTGMAIANGLSIGMTALVAKGIGEKDNTIISKTAESGLFLALILSVLLGGSSYLFSKKFVIGLGGEGDYLKYGLEYFKYIIPIVFFLFFGSVLGGILKGEGLMKKFMISMIIGTTVNIILDPIFIFVLNLGVKGAAIATVISQGMAFLYTLSIFIKNQSLIKLKWDWRYISNKVIKRILKIGFPQSFSQFVMSVAFIIMNRIAIYIDPKIVTSSSLVGRMEQIVYLPIFAIAGATVTIVGQNVGRNNLKRVEKIWKTSIGLSMITLLFLAIIFFIFAPYLYGAFNQGEMVTYYAITQTRYGMPFILTAGIVIITRSTYQGMGYPIPGLVLTSLRFFIIVIPVMYLMVYGLNLGFKGILYSHIISMLISATIALFWIRNSMKKLQNGTLKIII